MLDPPGCARSPFPRYTDTVIIGRRLVWSTQTKHKLGTGKSCLAASPTSATSNSPPSGTTPPCSSTKACSIPIELLEELWQARPIVSGRSPVAEAVLSRPRVGVLADTAREQAHAIVRLLNRPAEAARIGAAAKARVASHNLITHHVAGYLKLFPQVSRKRAKRAKNRNS